MNNKLFDSACYVSTVTLASLKVFGLQSLQYQPEILRDMFQQRFVIKKMPQKLFDKLNCGYSLVGTNLYTSSIQAFLGCNYVMAGKPLDSDKVAYNSMQDIAWGVWQYCNLVGQLQNGKPAQQFSPDIIKYIQQLAKLRGITRLPTWLSFAQQDITMPVQLTSDPSLFQAYNQRQQAQVNNLNQFVVAKQKILTAQLKQLKSTGILQ